MRLAALVLVAALGAAGPAAAAPSPDDAFGAGGRVVTPFGPWAAQPFGVAALPGGRVAIAAGPGSFDDAQGGGQALVGVLDARGRRDPSFSQDGVAVVRGADAAPDSLGVVVAAPDGRVVAGGSTTGAALVVALRADGSPDAGFGDGGRARLELEARSAVVTSIAPAPGGAVVVAGAAERPGRSTDAFVARLRADGSLDRRFAGGVRWLPLAAPGRFDAAAGVAVRHRRVVVAASVEVGGVASGPADVDTRNFDWAVVRLTPRGRLDRSFSRDGVARVRMGAEPRGRRDQDFLRGVFTARGGRILLAGGIDTGGLGLATLRANGRVARRALIAGPLFAFGAARDARGRVLVVGERRQLGEAGAPALARFTARGLGDASFAPGGVFTFDLGAGLNFARAVAAGPGELVTVAGDDAVVRLRAP